MNNALLLISGILFGIADAPGWGWWLIYVPAILIGILIKRKWPLFIVYMLCCTSCQTPSHTQDEINEAIREFDTTAVSEPGTYPDPKLTPGALNPAVTQDTIGSTICKPGYTRTIRNVPQSMRKQAFAAYGIKDHFSEYELDHEISLQNGGSNDIKNLWPQKYCPVGNKPLVSGCWGAREKDVVESALRRWVCKGKMTLAEDIEVLKTHWVECYKTIKEGKICQDD